MGRAAALLAVALLLAACGDSADDDRDRDEIAAAVTEYLGAVYHQGDFAAACDRLAPQAQRDLIESRNRQLEGVRLESCGDTLRGLQRIGSLEQAAAGVVDSDRLQPALAALPQLTVENLEIQGDAASATVAGSQTPVRLRKVGDEWKIARLGSGASPP